MIDDLIKRLKNATGPDRELDREIALTCVPNAKPYENDPRWIRVPSEMERDQVQLVMPLPYTASIDAALTLVPPEGYGWEIHHWSEYDHATIGHLPAVLGHTPVLALCIAALARAAIAAKMETAT